jgi:hypothetical protein
MMRKLALAAAATVTAVTATLVPATAAQAADTPTCVTRAEYKAVHKGMTKTRVHRIFDISGKRMAIAHSGGFTSEIRSYKTCQKFSAVSIAYDNGKLSAKSAVWVG